MAWFRNYRFETTLLALTASALLIAFAMRPVAHIAIDPLAAKVMHLPAAVALTKDGGITGGLTFLPTDPKHPDDFIEASTGCRYIRASKEERLYQVIDGNGKPVCATPPKITAQSQS